MTVHYHIYSNHGSGGPIDFSAPLLTTSDLSCIIGPLDPSTDHTFLVRAFAVDTNLEEANTIACARVVIGNAGIEIGDLPNQAHALILSSIPGGGCLVGWGYAPQMGRGIPDRFNVYFSSSEIDYGLPMGTVPYVKGRVGYTYLIPGPLQPATYKAVVRSINASGSDQNTTVQELVIGRSALAYSMDQPQGVVISG